MLSASSLLYFFTAALCVAAESSGCVTSQPSGRPAPAGAYPDPAPCTGNCSAFEDQVVVRRVSDGLYFRFAFDAGSANDALFTAPSLGGPWKFVTDDALGRNLKSRFGPIGIPWAPDVQYIDGQYVAFYTDHYVRNTSSTDHAEVLLAYATSTTMEPGSFTNQGPFPIPSGPKHLYSRISPSYLAADPPMMVFGSDSSGMFYVNLSINLPDIDITPSGAKPVELISSQLNLCSAGRNSTEDPAMYQHPNGYTYAFFTNGVNFPGKKGSYADYQNVEVCRSEHPHYGYVNKLGQSCLEPGTHATGTLVLESHGNSVLGPGSPAVIEVPGVGAYLIYQYFNWSEGSSKGSAAKLYGHNLMDFSSGWPVLVETTANTTSPSATTSTSAPTSTSTKHSAANRAGYSTVALAFALAFMLFANTQ